MPIGRLFHFIHSTDYHEKKAITRETIGDINAFALPILAFNANWYVGVPNHPKSRYDCEKPTYRYFLPETQVKNNYNE